MGAMIAAAPTEIPRAAQRPLEGYLAVPASAARVPAVVVVHEIFGLNDDIRSIARRFAERGYVALAVNLFSGGSRVACLLRVLGGMLSRSIDSAPVRDLQSAVDWLRQQPAVDPRRIGAVGFCMGGGYALALACVDDDIRAASIFYAMNPRPLSAVADACPIIGSYPQHDFTRRAAMALDAALGQHGVPHDIKIYPDTRHGFFNAGRRVHDAEASADAWARTCAFLDQHLAVG
jgi:carboxymethylenebutenolidase